MTDEIYDITIIGGGPAGLFTAFYGGMRQAKVKLIESLPHLGGQLTALYPEKYICDIAGIPKIRAQQLVDNLAEQIQIFDPTIVLEQSIKTVEKMDGNTFKLISINDEVHFTKTIIITAGNGAFQPRLLNVGNSEDFEGVNLHYNVPDMDIYRNQHVLLLGGGDSAVDWALMLEPIAKKVTLVHRRDQFTAHEHSMKNLAASSVDIMTPFTPTAIEGQEKIEQVTLREARGTREIQLEVDYVLCQYGFVSNLGPIKDWGFEIEKNSIVVNSKLETNIPGIYAAGDINTYPGKVQLIATGFGDGPIAVNNAMQFLDPSARLQPKHSTSMF